MHLSNGEIELKLFSMITVFGTPCDVTTDEIRIETFYPGDASSEKLLRDIANAH